MNALKQKQAEYSLLSKKDKIHFWTETLINNALYIFMIFAIAYIVYKKPAFIGASSILNILKLTAANMPIALGIAGCIILQGTDLSAGRAVGLTACISASMLQATDYGAKMFPGLERMPILLVLLMVVVVGAILGMVNGYCISKFSLHPFIVTLATQLITYGILLIYVQLGSNGGQAISGLDKGFTGIITGNGLTEWLTKHLGDGKIIIPNYVIFAVIITAVMWVVWNKTTFGKNMFAVGSNPEAAHVSGVNVKRITILVFVLAGVLYAYTGFIESARISGNSANTGLNYELDAIAACVIGGVSFVGGIGKIRGVIMGVFLLRIIFVGLTFLGIPNDMQYIIKGLIILVACAIDMRKYLVRK